MNWFDIIILIPCLIGLIKGVINGLVKEAVEIVSLVAGIWLAVRFSAGGVALFLEVFPSLNQCFGIYTYSILKAIFFIVILMLVVIIMGGIGRLIERMLEKIALGGINKILGAVFGCVKGAIIAILIFYILDVLGFTNSFINEKTRKESFLLEYVEKISNKIHENSQVKNSSNRPVVT